MKGGDGAADYMLKTVGNGGVQYDNVFRSSSTDVSNSNNMVKPFGMTGGRRKQTANRKRGRSRSGRSRSGRNKAGGFLGLGPIINQALVPFTLLGSQKWFR